MKKTKILIVEDELIVAEDLASNLEFMEYEITDILTTGEEAIESVKNNLPDCVMMDITLQGEMTGVDVAAILKKDFSVPVVFLTAHTNRDYLDRAKLTEPYGYLLKPFQDKDILMTIETAIYKHGIELKLQENEKKFRSIVENSHAGICILDEKGIVTYVNHKMAVLLGVKEEEILGKEFVIFLNKDDSVVFSKILGKIDFMDQESDREIEITLPGGIIRNLEVRASVIRDENDEIKIISQFLDITDRKKNQKKIQMLAHAVESINESVIVTNMENKVLFVNEAFVRKYGYSHDEILNKPVDIIRSKNNPLNINKDLFLETLDGGWQGELLNVDKWGREFPVFLTTSIIRDEKDYPVALVGVSRDISSDKEMQLHLRQQQKMESIGNLAGGVAHDFNNLLAVINGYTELIIGKIDVDSTIYSFLKEIEHAGNKAADLTRQLLTFSRKQVIKPKIIQINIIISNLAKMLKRIIGENIEMSMDLHEEVLPIKADPGQIEQLLMNLVINARDAINEKEYSDKKLISITSDQVVIDESFPDHDMNEHPGKYILIKVSDTGVGIEESARKKIFDPFYTTKAKGKGTGLGLSTVYGIIKQNKAYIIVDSTPGGGAEFNIYWPCLDDLLTEVSPEITKDSLRQGSETILLVEDNEKVRALSETIVKSLGYNVISAVNGKEAFEIISMPSIKIDLIISDVIMPVMDGIELAKKIQENNFDLPILFSSGYSDEYISIENLKDIGVDFINKPYSVKEISKKIRKILDNEN